MNNCHSHQHKRSYQFTQPVVIIIIIITICISYLDIYHFDIQHWRWSYNYNREAYYHEEHILQNRIYHIFQAQLASRVHIRYLVVSKLKSSRWCSPALYAQNIIGFSFYLDFTIFFKIKILTLRKKNWNKEGKTFCDFPTQDNFNQSHRDLILTGFRESCFSHLIATNVFARGINVPQVCTLYVSILHFQ